MELNDGKCWIGECCLTEDCEVSDLEDLDDDDSVGSFEPLDLTGKPFCEKVVKGFRINHEPNGTSDLMECKECIECSEVESTKDTVKKVSGRKRKLETGKKKKKKSKKSKCSTSEKRKKKKTKNKRLRVKSSDAQQQLLPEDLSISSQTLSANTAICTAEEADSSSEAVRLALERIEEKNPFPDGTDGEETEVEDAMEVSASIQLRQSINEEFLSSSSASLRRGTNGWEECLRPRPMQVQHYQSIIEMRKKQIGTENEKMPHPKKPKEEIDKESIVSTCSSKKSEQVLSSTESRKPSNLKSINRKKSKMKKAMTERHDLDGLLSDSSVSDHEGSEGSGKFIDARVGDIVWAKLASTRWWPAIVINGSDCGQPPARCDHVWVFWFGDHKISELPRSKLLEFMSKFSAKYKFFGGKLYRKGVVEAVRELSIRVGLNFDKDVVQILEWAKNGFDVPSDKANLFAPDNENPLPEHVLKYVNRIKTQYLQALHYFGHSAAVATTNRFEQLQSEDTALKKVRNGTLKIEDVCISCNTSSVEIVAQHPLIQGGLCKRCRDAIVETMFAYGDDGTNAYCIICGQAGELVICDNIDCNRCYCAGCIEVFVSPGAHRQVLETSPWLCFLCSDYDPVRNGLIRRKEEWQQNVMQMFQPGRTMSLTPSPEEYKEKRPVRVLSLFDGIGTGKLVLDSLGIEIDVYYASEIDNDAINVTVVQHKDAIKQLGRIEKVTDSEVARLCPLDLVIGGSPCNDLSLVNPARKGLYDPTGTGKLFFDFFRILRAVQLANKGRHVFWLYENVAAMPQEYKGIISRFLQCEPAMIDSKYFSAQNRARYFWGNVPGMYTPLQPHHLRQHVTLDSVLTPHLNRRASVEKIRTVTTRSNSLKQGKKCLLPVHMNGEGDVLWVTELEEIFGFPRHWTDTGNIPLGRRQQLLGKAWSVPVIKHLFTPLKNFFKTQSSLPSSSPSSSSSCNSTTTAIGSPACQSSSIGQSS